MNQPLVSAEFSVRIFDELHSQIQWNYIDFQLGCRKIKHDFTFTYFQNEFGAHTLWIWSTHEYYNFTNGELQTPARNDSRSTSVFWWECVFVWTFHLNQHHSNRTDSEQRKINQNRRVVLQDEIRYWLTVFCYTLQCVWSLSGYILGF